MIIIEGPDGSGKSTLAETLAGKFDMEVYHPGGPPRDAAYAYARMLEQRNRYGSILDRCTHISEAVYSKVLDEPVLAEDILMEDLQRYFKDWYIIYCRPSKQKLLDYAANKLDEIAKNKPWKPEERVAKTKQNVIRIVDEYDRVMRKVQALGLKVLVSIPENEYTAMMELINAAKQ